MPEVIMPKMGDGMESGVLVAWRKQKGDEVAVGDVIAEIDVDKGSMDLEAEDAGVLHELIANEGDEVPVGERIAVIVGEGEEPPDDGDGADEEPSADAEDAEDEQGDEEEGTEKDEDEDEEQERAGDEAQDGDGGAAPDKESDGDVRASPIVRRLAKEHDLDLSRVEGSGPDGRIVERDVRAALEGGPDGGREAERDDAAQARPAAEPSLPEPTGAPGAEVHELSRLQQVVGDRMQQSWQGAPHHFATVEVDVGELLALRAELNEELADEDVKLSINDFVVKASAAALGEHPKLNALMTSEGLEVHETVELAIAVALDEGLVTPVIRDAGRKALSAISAEAKDLAARAQEGELSPDEYQGGTFTISNMGMYGVESFTAVINPPSVSILAVGAVVRRPAFDEHDQVVPRSLMKLTVSSDHRAVNGADHARFLAEVKRLLERPKLLTV
jgi:pyruvate dehydrogenase E2 component (dihydrolipoamide acetyltransferase)